MALRGRHRHLHPPRAVSGLRPAIRHKKPHFQCDLYRECGSRVWGSGFRVWGLRVGCKGTHVTTFPTPGFPITVLVAAYARSVPDIA
eukprot:800142-Rhodomonas_salina.1